MNILIRRIGLAGIFLFLALAPIFSQVSAAETAPTNSVTLNEKTANMYEKDMIDATQRGLDRSISLLNFSINVFSLILAVVGVAIAGLTIFNILEINKSKKLREEAEIIKNQFDKLLTDVSPIIANANLINSKKVELEKLKYLLEIQFKDMDVKHKFSDELKQTLEEYVHIVDMLETMGQKLSYVEYLNRGRKFYFDEKYYRALQAFEKAIEEKSGDAIAWYNKGICLSKIGDYDGAIKAVNKAIDTDPDFEIAWYNKGYFLFRQTRYDESIKALEKVTSNQLFKPKAVFNIACAYSKLNNKDQTLMNLKEAICLDVNCKQKAPTDPDFEWLWNDPDFKNLVND